MAKPNLLPYRLIWKPYCQARMPVGRPDRWIFQQSVIPPSTSLETNIKFDKGGGRPDDAPRHGYYDMARNFFQGSPAFEKFYIWNDTVSGLDNPFADNERGVVGAVRFHKFNKRYGLWLRECNAWGAYINEIVIDFMAGILADYEAGQPVKARKGRVPAHRLPPLAWRSVALSFEPGPFEGWRTWVEE